MKERKTDRMDVKMRFGAFAVVIMLLMLTISSQVVLADSDTITNGLITVTIDTTFPQPLQYQLCSNGAILYGADSADPHTIYINGTSYSASVTSFTKGTDYATYMLSVPGVNVNVAYRFELSGNALVRKITGITGTGEQNINRIRIDNPILKIQSTQTGASAAWTNDVWSGLRDDTVNSLSNLPVGSNGVTWAFLYTSSVVGTAYSNAYDQPFTLTVGDDSGTRYVSLKDRDYYYRVGSIKPDIWFDSRTYIGGDTNNSGSVNWQDGAIWIRNQLPPVPAALEDFFENGGMWNHTNVAFIGTPDLNLTEINTISSYYNMVSQQRQTYYQTDGMAKSSYECAGWQGKGHDWMWPDWSVQIVNPGLGGRSKMDWARTEMAKYNGDLSFHVNQDDALVNSQGYNENILAMAKSYDENKHEILVPKLSFNYYGIDAYQISHFKDLLLGNPQNRINGLKSTFWAPSIVYQDVMKNNTSEDMGYGDVEESYAKKIEIETWQSGASPTMLTSEYYQQNDRRNGRVMSKRYNCWSEIDNFINAGVSFFQNNLYGSEIEPRLDSYDLLWGQQTASRYRCGNYNSTQDWGSNAVVEDTYLFTLMNSYMRNYSAMEYINDAAKYQVRWGSNLIARADKTTGNFTLMEGNIVIADGTDRFIPLPDGSQKIYVYSKNGSNREWVLPVSWSGVQSVNRYELTESGRVFIDSINVSNGAVTLVSTAGVPYVLEQGDSYTPPIGPVNSAKNQAASASSSYGSDIPANAVDGNIGTRWTSTEANGSWLQIDLGRETEINRVVISESGNFIQSYHVQYWDGMSWQNACAGTTIGASASISFPNVRSNLVRLYIDSTNSNPSISEFSVYADANLLRSNRVASASTNSAQNPAVYGYASCYRIASSGGLTYTYDVQASMAMDGAPQTYWASTGTNGSWLQADMTRTTKFNRVVISEYGSNITGYHIQYWDGFTWQNAYTGTTIGDMKEINLPALLTTTKVRLYIDSTTGEPCISEFGIYNVGGIQDSQANTPYTLWNIKVNDNEASITKSGAVYSPERGLGDYRNDLHNTSGGGYYQFTFTGTGVKWITEKEPNGGMCSVYIDDAMQQTVNLYNATRLVQQVVYEKTGLANDTHTIRVVGTNGYNCTLDAFEYTTGTLVNDNDSSITKSGSAYSPGRGVGDYMDDLHNTSIGGYYQFTFTGTGVRWITEKEPNGGMCSVFIDGVLQQTVNLYNATRLVRQAVFEKSGLANGTHTIRVVGTSGYNCTLDAFEYSAGTMVNDNNGMIEKSGAVYDPDRGLGDYMDDLHNASDGGYYQFTFTATVVRWIAEKEPNGGICSVYIDGVLQQTVNLYNSNRLVQQVVFEKGGLSSGVHTIRIVGTNGYNCTLDTFEYE